MIASLFLLLNPDAEEDTKEESQYGFLICPPYYHFSHLRFCIQGLQDLTERHRLCNKHYNGCINMWKKLT